MKKSKVLDLYSCLKCKDTYWIVEGNSFKRCECYELMETKRLFEKSGITEKDYSFTNFKEWNEKTKAMKMAAMEYYKNFMEIKDKRNNSIAFLGQSGCGKTHLSIAIALNILRSKKIAVTYFSYRDSVTELKQNSMNEEIYKKLINRLKNAKVLIIDDMLKGKTTEADTNIMFEIINHRYINHLPIILSSEHSISELIAFDEAIGSRIFEMCKDYLIEIDKDIKNNFRVTN